MPTINAPTHTHELVLIMNVGRFLTATNAWQVRAEVDDVKKENQQQKEDLLQTIRENDTQIKLMNFILDNFVPEEERIKIEEHCTWDDESCDWIVAHQHLTGLALPTSPSH